MGESPFDHADRRLNSDSGGQPGDGVVHLFRLVLYMQHVERVAREIMRLHGLQPLVAWSVALKLMIDHHDAQRPAQTESDIVDEDQGAELDHPAIRTARMTCSACPEQWEGELHDGRFFYFRYRFGRATLALGANRQDVSGVTQLGQCEGVDVSMLEHGGRYDGSLGSDQVRAEVFARLFDHEHGGKARFPGNSTETGTR